MKKRLTLLAASLIVTLSASAGMLTENTQGGYAGLAPHYTAKSGVLYAYDGSNWYALKQAQVPVGTIGGLSAASSERWVRCGGSRVTTYSRTAQTFRDQSLKPVFQQN